jgi:hypothetical protein
MLSTELISLTYWTLVVPIVYIWIQFLNGAELWTDLIPDYRSYYGTFAPYVLDYFFIVFYILVFEFVVRAIVQEQQKTLSIYWKTLLFIGIITFFDVLYGFFVSKAPGDSFFLRFFRGWASKAGWRAIVWDVFYIGVIYIAATSLQPYAFNMNLVWMIFSFLMIFILTLQTAIY